MVDYKLCCFAHRKQMQCFVCLTQFTLGSESKYDLQHREEWMHYVEDLALMESIPVLVKECGGAESEG